MLVKVRTPDQEKANHTVHIGHLLVMLVTVSQIRQRTATVPAVKAIEPNAALLIANQPDPVEAPKLHQLSSARFAPSRAAATSAVRTAGSRRASTTAVTSAA